MTSHLDLFLRSLGHLAAMMQTLDVAISRRLDGSSLSTIDLPIASLTEVDPFPIAYYQGINNPTTDTPDVLYRMCFAYAAGLFEDYLNSLLRTLMQNCPAMLHPDREQQAKGAVSPTLSYADIISTVTTRPASKVGSSLIDEMIDRELKELTYKPKKEILRRLRRRYGFKSLSTEWDERLIQLSLIRNCVVHNQSLADKKLAEATFHFYRDGSPIYIDRNVVSRALSIYRRFSLELDKLAEKKLNR